MAADKNESQDNALAAEVATDLDRLENAVREGRDVVARNLSSCLLFEVLPFLQPQAREQLSRAMGGRVAGAEGGPILRDATASRGGSAIIVRVAVAHVP